jgi:hypothetical protein
VLLAFAAFWAACAPIRVHRTARDVPRDPVQVSRWTAILWDFEPLSSPVNLNERCNSPWDTVSSGVSTGQAWIRGLTLGIYTPSQIKVVCETPKPPKEEDEQN